jgi:hypothetical protein
MSPTRVEKPVSWPTEADTPPPEYNGPPRNLESIRNLHFDPSLQPTKYEMLGTHAESQVLFLDVNILDSTGREPFHGDVYVEGMLHNDPPFDVTLY